MILEQDQHSRKQSRSGGTGLGDEGADLGDILLAGGGFDPGGDVDGGGTGLGDGLGNVFRGQAAREDEAFFGKALAGEIEEVPGKGFADTAIQAGIEGVEEDVGARVVSNSVEAGFIADLQGFDDVDPAIHEGSHVLRCFITVELDAVEKVAGNEGVQEGGVGIDDHGDEGGSGGEGGEPGAGGFEWEVAFGVRPKIEADGIRASRNHGFCLVGSGEAADFDAEAVRRREGGHEAASGQGWEEVLSEAEEGVEFGRYGEVTAYAGVALEVIELGDFGGTEEVDDRRGGVSAGVGVGIGFGEEAVEDNAGERFQGEGDEQEGVFPPEAHFEGTFGVGGIIDFAVAEGHQGLPDDTAVGEAFFDDENAGGHCDGRKLACANRNATETDGRVRLQAFDAEVAEGDGVVVAGEADVAGFAVDASGLGFDARVVERVEVGVEDFGAVEGNFNLVSDDFDFLGIPFSSGAKEATFGAEDMVEGSMDLVGGERFAGFGLVAVGVDDLEFEAVLGAMSAEGGADGDAIVASGREFEFKAEGHVAILFFGEQIAAFALFADDVAIDDFVIFDSALPVGEVFAVVDTGEPFFTGGEGLIGFVGADFADVDVAPADLAAVGLELDGAFSVHGIRNPASGRLVCGFGLRVFAAVGEVASFFVGEEVFEHGVVDDDFAI